MKSSPFAPAAGQGRPRAVVLSPEQAKALAKIYLGTNRTRDSGSMEMAWVLFTETPAGKEHAWTVIHRRVATGLCQAALEVMRRARKLVGAHRGGPKRLRSEGPCVEGGMRIHWAEHRRLYAGEQYSVDDLTRNVPCWIPWPWGGCKCSNAHGVRLGRWQTLAVHDDASGMVVAVKSVFRYEQSYRGADAASVVYQTEREIGMAGFQAMQSRWVVEGGVWQSEQMLAALAGRFISAKGRPNQKLIEGWFNGFQTRDSVHSGDVGRIRGENLATNTLYLACRDGREDPRKRFLAFEDGQERLMESIRWMNTKEVRSRHYGNWVPQERWDADTAARPLVTRDAADAWVMSPERRRLKVTRGAMLKCQACGPLGVPMPLVFQAPWLWEHAGRSVDVYFDPLGQWPVTATVACPRTRRALGTVVCQNTFGQSRDADAEMAKAVRQTMMSELRCITGSGKRILEARGIGGTAGREETPAAAITISTRSGIDSPADREKRGAPHDGAVLDPQPSNRGGWNPFPDPAAADPRGVREAAAAPALRSLGKRAEAAREETYNW